MEHPVSLKNSGPWETAKWSSGSLLPENPPLLPCDSADLPIRRWSRLSRPLNLGWSGWLRSLEGGGSDAGPALSPASRDLEHFCSLLWKPAQLPCGQAQANTLKDGTPWGTERSPPSWGSPRPAMPWQPGKVLQMDESAQTRPEKAHRSAMPNCQSPNS